MYLFLNRSLGMSTGKASAQVAHAAVEAYLISDPKAVEQWRIGLHYCKLVMLAEDEVHLITIQKYIEERGFKTKLIIDEGRTEIRPLSMTALGVAVVDRDDLHTQVTFETFKLYKENPRVQQTLEGTTRQTAEWLYQYTEPYGRRLRLPPRWSRRNR
jgi:peptidyl-tRNA hydrolase